MKKCLLALTVVAILVSACGSQEKATDTPQPRDLPTAPVTPAPTPTDALANATSPPPPPTNVPSEGGFFEAAGDTWVRPADGAVMVYVPSGEFTMGSSQAQLDTAASLCEQYPDGWNKCDQAQIVEDEAPPHTVTLDGFWIDRAEVTNAQYELCVQAGACRPSRLAGNPAYNRADYPAAGIPWQQAANYCAWAGGRLPTEAEWEYAARGASGALYPWGDSFDCQGGNFGDDDTDCDDGYPEPAPVGSFPAGVSWCGALDMAGNVWEWVSDTYGAYPVADQANPTGPASGDQRILRGGSWGYGPPFVRSAYRYPVPPGADYLAVGLRCAASTTPELGPDETATLASLEQVDDYPLYTMHYYSDYELAEAAPNRSQWLAQAKPSQGGAGACALFAALGDAEHMVYGRNFDWRYSPALLLFTDPPDGYASVSMVDIDYLVGADKAGSLLELPLAERQELLAAPRWPFDGMNEHGLTIGMAAVPPGQVPPDPAKETLDSLDVMREVLDHAQDVDEALAILQSYNIDMGEGPPLHYLVADPSGRAFLLEFYQGETVILPNQAPWHLATNFLRASAGESAFGECWRYDEIYEQLEQSNGQVTAHQAMDILSQVSQDNTEWSVVYDMSTGEVMVTMGKKYDDDFHVFHLNAAGE